MTTSNQPVAPTFARAAADALIQAAKTEHDFAGWLAATLSTAAARLGSSDALTAGRAGSWEASLVDQLVKGTVGYDDEYLPVHAAASEAGAEAGPGLTAEQLATLAQALADAADHREARGSDGFCADCETAPSGLCPDHEADMDRADSYRQLARDLGLELQ